MTYNYKKELSLPFEESVETVKNSLKQEGFGVLTEIDVKKTLKEKLDIEYDNYIILGACNPALANKALQAEKEIGLFLPCNVIVYINKKGKIIVSAINPVEAMSMIDNPELKEIAKQVKEKLEKVINNITK